MGGWKTWLGGLVAVVVGIAGLAYGFLSNEISIMLLSAGFGAMGVIGIGLGHKIEKANSK
jgi:hypothetical protein